jgi:hypothetical protein
VLAAGAGRDEGERLGVLLRVYREDHGQLLFFIEAAAPYITSIIGLHEERTLYPWSATRLAASAQHPP